MGTRASGPWRPGWVCFPRASSHEAQARPWVMQPIRGRPFYGAGLVLCPCDVKVRCAVVGRTVPTGSARTRDGEGWPRRHDHIHPRLLDMLLPPHGGLIVVVHPQPGGASRGVHLDRGRDPNPSSQPTQTSSPALIHGRHRKCTLAGPGKSSRDRREACAIRTAIPGTRRTSIG